MTPLHASDGAPSRWHLHPCLVLRQKRHQDLWQFIAATWPNEAMAGQLQCLFVYRIYICIVSTTYMHAWIHRYIYIYIWCKTWCIPCHHVSFISSHIVSYYVKLQYIISYYTKLHIYIYCFKIIYDYKYIHTRVCSYVYRTWFNMIQCCSEKRLDCGNKIHGWIYRKGPQSTCCMGCILDIPSGKLT